MKKLVLGLLFPAMFSLNVNASVRPWGTPANPANKGWNTTGNHSWGTPARKASNTPRWDVSKINICKWQASGERSRITSKLSKYSADALGAYELDLSTMRSLSRKEKGEMLIKCCEYGDWGSCGYNVRLLIENGADVNYQRNEYFSVSPLISACRERFNIKLVQFLIIKGADVNLIGSDENGYSCTPLIYACRCGNLEIVQVLVNAGADVNKRINYSDPSKPANPALDSDNPALAAARASGNNAIVAFLISEGAK